MIKNNKILVLAILIIIFGYLLISCKNKNESFVNVEDEEINTLMPKARGFRVINMTSEKVKVEFYAPEAEGNDPESTLVENNNLTNEDIGGYIIVVAKYDSTSPNAKPISNNYKSIFINNDSSNEISINIPRYNSKYFTKTIRLNGSDEMNNNNNDTYFYKLGLIVSYSDANGPRQSMIANIENPRIKANNYFFKLEDKDIKQVDIDFQEYLKFKEAQPKEVEISDDTCSNSADGKLEFIKRNLGGYPDNLFVEERTGPKSLGELAKRQLSLGILDINVHTKDL